LCYTCGEKYEPGHQVVCPKGKEAQIHVLTTEDMTRVLTEEDLKQVEQEEKQEEEIHRLSTHVISGASATKCIRIRATVQDQAMLMFIYSGSSISFISQSFMDKLGLKTESCSPMLLNQQVGS
jgi:hypothetical protein